MENNWVLEHLELVGADEREAAKKLLLSKVPPKLYKYRRLNGFTLESLQREAIWMSSVTALNDPYECYPKLEPQVAIQRFFQSPHFKNGFKLQFNQELSEEEVATIVTAPNMSEAYRTVAKTKGINAPSLDTAIKGVRKIFNEDILSLRGKIHLCSFSETVESVIMWSHYADEHKGICIEYDFTQFEDGPLYLYPVNYSNELFDFTPSFTDVRRKYLFAFAVLQKGEDWRYEKEWRIAYPIEEEIKDRYFKAPRPTAIYLGSRFSESDSDLQHQLMGLINEQNIPIKSMQMDSSNYRIVPARTEL